MEGFQAGVATIGPSNSGQEIMDLFLDFPEDYPSTENLIVLVTPLQDPFNQPSNISDCFAVTVTSITTTGFGVNVFRVDSTVAWGQNLLLMWMAFYTTES